jgi:DNA-binding NarL/FixJ family response regulator
VLKAEAALPVAVEAAVGQGAFVSARAVPGLVRVVLQPVLAAGACRRLTPQEQRVTVFLARGYFDKEIAEHLDVAPSTVATHVRGILGKLGVGSRAEVVPPLLGRGGAVGRRRARASQDR